MPVHYRSINKSLISAMLIATALLFTACSEDSGGTYPPNNGGGDVPIDNPVINQCLDSEGIDLFAAEGDTLLGLSWNNNGDFNATGGYQIRYGSVTGSYSDRKLVPDCTIRNCEYTLEGLVNNNIYYVVVDALDTNEVIVGTSCELSAQPHELAFGDDVQVNLAPETVDVTQKSPQIASAWDGSPLYMVWEENSKVVYSRSNDHGASWGAAVHVLDGISPSLVFRRYVPETNATTGEIITDENGDPIVKVAPAMFIALQSGSDIKLVRADFPNDDVANNPVLRTVTTFDATGTLPDITAVGEHIEIAFVKDDAIYVTSSTDDNTSFSTPQRVDSGALAINDVSSTPSVAIDPTNNNVYVAYDGKRNSGDSDIYLNVSTDSGTNYLLTEVPIDDAAKNNQSLVSLAVDGRTGAILATWEDRRVGADVYFSHSEDNGTTWAKNLQVGAGLGGDQTQPEAVADAGRNVYVVFIDSTNGKRPMFSRFNATDTFDPALDVSTAAGQGGAEAREPTVSIDDYGNIYVGWTENRGDPDRDVFFALGR